MRKVPKPIYTNAPMAILSVPHRGVNFRIEMFGHFGCDAQPRFEFFDHYERKVTLWDFGYDEYTRFRRGVALWMHDVHSMDDPDPDMPHAAIRRVLDVIYDGTIAKQEADDARRKAENPGSILEQLRAKRRETAP